MLAEQFKEILIATVNNIDLTENKYIQSNHRSLNNYEKLIKNIYFNVTDFTYTNDEAPLEELLLQHINFFYELENRVKQDYMKMLEVGVPSSTETALDTLEVLGNLIKLCKNRIYNKHMIKGDKDNG